MDLICKCSIYYNRKKNIGKIREKNIGKKWKIDRKIGRVEKNQVLLTF